MTSIMTFAKGRTQRNLELIVTKQVTTSDTLVIVESYLNPNEKYLFKLLNEESKDEGKVTQD